MQNYKLYFTIFNKKMQCTIEAKNEQEAVNILRNKLNIVRIETVQKPQSVDDLGFVDYFKKMGVFK